MARRDPAYLIVNADDYAYSAPVSEGILDCARQGVVTATAIFANSPDIEEHSRWLSACGSIDVGVHLNMTFGSPLTDAMQRRFAQASGRFPGKGSLMRQVFAGILPAREVHDEWRAQIERCLDHGLKPIFLNSHEHVHMAPPLFAVARSLAERFGIRHLRLPTGSLFDSLAPAGLLRGVALNGFARLNRKRFSVVAPDFLGLGASGRLGAAEIRRELRRIRPGRVYELMCHPGRVQSDAVLDSRVNAYHQWAQEHAALTDPALPALLSDLGVRLVGYRDLDIRDRRLVALGRAMNAS